MHRRNKCVILLSLLLSAAGCGDTSGELAGAYEEAVGESHDELANCDVSIDPEREIVITHLSVVGDPKRTTGMGPWTFGRLMTDLAEGTNVPAFVQAFFDSWKTDQVINGFQVAARSKIEEEVLAPWREASAPGRLDLDKAPLRLLAITNRLDLAGASGHAGEGRFVFGVLGRDGRTLPFTVIFEFRLPTNGGRKAERWAREWHALAALPLGSPEYNARLEAITRQFATAGTLAQVRTNEIALASPWELREFHLDKGRLKPAAMALTPDLSFDGTPTLVDFIARNEKKIDAEVHAVKPKFRGDRFEAGSALAPTPSFQWNAPGVDKNLLEKFSRNTCNGCHTGNTGTFFLHIGHGAPGQPARLSNFLATVDIPSRAENMKRLLCR